MSDWGKIYPERILHDRKFKHLSDAAVALWFRSWCLCVLEDTKGHIHHKDLTAELRGTVKAAKELIEAGLWAQTADGWELVNFLKWNAPLAESKSERVSHSEGGKIGMHRRHHLLKGVTNPNCTYCKNPNYLPNSVNNETSNEVINSVVTEYRDKSIDIKPKPNGLGKSDNGDNETKIAHRLPADWQPTPEMLTWANTEFPAVDSRLETDNFKDYWAAEGGAKARKLDWCAAWRNWIRRSAERAPRMTSFPAKPQQDPEMLALLRSQNDAA